MIISFCVSAVSLNVVLWLVFFKGELESTIAELEESNCKLASLKAQRDSAKGAIFPLLNLGSKQVGADKAISKAKNMQDMESALKELMVICWPPSL